MAAIRVGIVGAGWVARNRHIPAYARDSRVRVLGIADHSSARAHDVATEFGIPYHTADPVDLFPRVDVVSICTPPWTHAELTTRALQHGCHVLVEKPMALTLAEARAMAEAAVESRRVLCVAHNFLFARSAQRALQGMEQGTIGNPVSLFAYQFSSWRRRIPIWHTRLPGGLFFDEAPHLLYLTRAILGELSVVTARLRRDTAGTLSRVQSTLQGERGEAQLEMVAGAPVSEWMLTVVGSEGMLVVDLFRDILTRVAPDREHKPWDVLNTSLHTIAQQVAGIITSGALFMSRRLSYGHNILVTRFIDAVTGVGPPPVTAEDGVAVVRTLEAIVSRAESAGQRGH